MKETYELTNKMKLDYSVFEFINEKAIELLSVVNKNQYTQAIVLLSSMGNEYSIIIENALSEEKIDEITLIGKLKEEKDSEICFVLCMWQDKYIEIPSLAFRNLLLDLNEKNSESILFVKTMNGVSGIKLSSTIK